MNIKKLIVSFLAPRHPAAYTDDAIARRLNASQMLDGRTSAEDVSDALAALHRLGLVELLIDPLDGAAYWQTTEAGVKRWVLEGRMTVE